MNLKELSVLPDFYKYIAPWILLNDFAKEILTLQIFTNPENKEKLHILLVGEPASAKSEILNDICSFTPQSNFVGKKVTPAGLIETFEYTKNILGIDEFDKIDKQVRDNLLEAMQSQQISNDKFGFHRKIPAKANILASCNPNNYKLIEEIPIHHQLKFGLALLSRFHLIIPFYSPPSSQYTNIALASEYDDEENSKRILQLREYLIHVRRAIPTVLIPNNILKQIGNYCDMLKQASPLQEIITPRTIEGFKSGVKASARQNLRKEATVNDFNRVKKIFDKLYL